MIVYHYILYVATCIQLGICTIWLCLKWTIVFVATVLVIGLPLVVYATEGDDGLLQTEVCLSVISGADVVRQLVVSVSDEDGTAIGKSLPISV